MAPRSYWKGYLKLSLVTCAVSMMPATTEGGKVRFHTMNRRTGHRLESRYVDALTGDEIEDEDQVKGYERGDNEYVMLEDDELDSVALESTRTIDIETFVPKESIEWIWYDSPHFLMPADEVGAEAFSVIRAAMQQSGTVGISRLVLYRRERPVMLEPRDRGIVLWTLRYGDEVRDPKDYFGDIGHTKPDPKLMKMISELIAQRSKPWSPSMVRDPVQARLLDIIKSKTGRGGKPAKAKSKGKEPEPPSNVVNLMDALRKSLGRKAPARR